jgi:hypothetical protein
MVLPASTLLLQRDTNALSSLILNAAVILESYGAWQWDLRAVALSSLLILAIVRQMLHKKRGIDWYASLHGYVSALGAIVCVYMNLQSQKLTGAAEPLRSCQCGGPLTIFHRILPAITAGYSLLDLYDGFYLGLDFTLHGFVTLAIMTFFCSLQVPHLIEPMLLMEVSTVFLTMVRADFLSPMGSAVVQGAFAVTFIAFRILLVPFFWFQLMATMYQEHTKATYQECISPSVLPVSFLVGLFFHCLNSYWLVKIVKKAIRKLSGTEGVQNNNDLNESDDHLDEQLKKIQ